MTIRHKSLASAATEEVAVAVAFKANTDVFNEDNIPFAHATSVELLEQSSAQLGSTATVGGYGHLNNTTRAAQIPADYSTGKLPQPPQHSSSSSSRSSSNKSRNHHL